MKANEIEAYSMGTGGSLLTRDTANGTAVEMANVTHHILRGVHDVHIRTICTSCANMKRSRFFYVYNRFTELA